MPGVAVAREALHDLCNLLTVIQTQGAVTRALGDPQSLRAALRTIEDAAEHLIPKARSLRNALRRQADPGG